MGENNGLWQEEEGREEIMAYVDGKNPGRMSMKGKTNLGKPMKVMVSKPGNIIRADCRGRGCAKIGK